MTAELLTQRALVLATLLTSTACCRGPKSDVDEPRSSTVDAGPVVDPDGALACSANEKAYVFRRAGKFTVKVLTPPTVIESPYVVCISTEAGQQCHPVGEFTWEVDVVYGNELQVHAGEGTALLDARLCPSSNPTFLAEWSLTAEALSHVPVKDRGVPEVGVLVSPIHDSKTGTEPTEAALPP